MATPPPAPPSNTATPPPAPPSPSATGAHATRALQQQEFHPPRAPQQQQFRGGHRTTAISSPSPPSATDPLHATGVLQQQEFRGGRRTIATSPSPSATGPHATSVLQEFEGGYHTMTTPLSPSDTPLPYMTGVLQQFPGSYHFVAAPPPATSTTALPYATASVLQFRGCPERGTFIGSRPNRLDDSAPPTLYALGSSPLVSSPSVPTSNQSATFLGSTRSSILDLPPYEAMFGPFPTYTPLADKAGVQSLLTMMIGSAHLTPTGAGYLCLSPLLRHLH
ncbi:hypothetical protein FA13DRAFT_1714976 [Coprinellus micaceus]|uniref:Uncharacterized protein n=1 Tax=Coprinellus micaceus TaxID=71717 RepID=A0A4Y7SQD2_COPMI|nr:hypothetical protein FA13DRAFT_1714976 [Coprinellus micaceus]